MDNEAAKKALKNYIYNYEYYVEKSKECEKFKNEVQKTITRAKSLMNCSSADIVFEENIKKILEYETKEEKILMDILYEKQNIETIIKLLEQPERMIMYLRYICFYTFNQIADKMHYSIKRIYQLHALGLEHFAEIYSQTKE